MLQSGLCGKVGTWGFATATPGSERKAKNDRDKFVEEITDRLEQVQLESHDALYLIELRDRETSFFYLDPPYFNSNMGHYGGYTETDFEALLRLCAKLQGKFLMSSYPSEILEKYVRENGWHQIRMEKVLSASSTRRVKTEVLTANYPIK